MANNNEPTGLIVASLGSRRGPQPRRRHCVIGALSPPAHAHLSTERAVAAVAHGPCAVTGPQRPRTARTAGAQASARQLQGPARSTQTNRQRSARPRAVLTACCGCGPVRSQVHDGGLAHPFTGASRTSSSSSMLTSTAGSSRGGASRRGRSAWVGLAHVDSHHDVPGRARSRPLMRTRRAPSHHGGLARSLCCPTALGHFALCSE